MDYDLNLLGKEINTIESDIEEISKEQIENREFSKIYFVLSFITPILVTLTGKVNLPLLLTNYLIFGTPLLVFSNILKKMSLKEKQKTETKKEYVEQLVKIDESSKVEKQYSKNDLKKLKASILAQSFYEKNKELVIKCANEDKLYNLINEYIINDNEIILYICVEFRKLVNNEKGKSLQKK